MKPRYRVFGIRGVSLVETLVGLAVFFIIATSVYQAYSVVLRIFATARVKFDASLIANEQLEIIRNLPYSKVGLVGGLPAGVIAPSSQVTRDGMNFNVGFSIQNIDDPFDGTFGGVPNDSSPADYKLVEITVTCISCLNAPSAFVFTDRVSPKGLEGSSSNGALFIQAINANGQAISGASVSIVNNSVNPAININDTTDNTGYLKVLDVPPSVQSYHITVTKAGYSTDGTYTTGVSNPNPVKPDATVALGQITQASFVIDQVSTVNVASVNTVCGSVPNINFTLTSTKLIGTGPDLPKFTHSYTTDGGGLLTVSNLEWDNYPITFSNANYDIGGVIPTLPLVVAPNSVQSLKLVMQPKAANSLLVAVKDAGTALPLSGALVTLTDNAFYYIQKTTGRGFLSQTDWSGGGGQDTLIDATKYWSDDGNIDAQTLSGEVKLKQTAPPNYVPSGSFISSTFDAGSASNFYTISAQPQSQPVQTGVDSLKFQFAATNTPNPNPASWNFLGPDGTANSYYTPQNVSVNSVHNGNRYFRYKAFFATANTLYSPDLADVAVTFASDCVAPGQALFQNLQLNIVYNVTVSLDSYQTYNGTFTPTQSWDKLEILLTPGVPTPPPPPPVQFNLNISKKSNGEGTVTSVPSGIDCGLTCLATYVKNTSVTLTAAADNHSTFSGWSGDCSGSKSTCTLLLDVDKYVLANFDSNLLSLTVIKNGTGVGSVTSSPAGIDCGVTCSGQYALNTIVTLTATADNEPGSASVFSGWSGACAGINLTCQVTMSQAQSVTAAFNLTGNNQIYTLTTATAGAGTGTINKNPLPTCQGNVCGYTVGTVVTLTATPTDSHSVFLSWSGDCSGTNSVCALTMSSNKSVTANFGIAEK